MGEQIIHLLARIAFRGIYFPQVSKLQWLRAISQNWGLVVKLLFRTMSGSPEPAVQEIAQETRVGSLVRDAPERSPS